MIYVIEASGLNAVKIGIARSPVSRVSELQTGCPADLFLRLAIDWDDKYERALHLIFSEHRIRGEWFRPVGSVEEFCGLSADVARKAFFDFEVARLGLSERVAYILAEPAPVIPTPNVITLRMMAIKSGCKLPESAEYRAARKEYLAALGA